MLLLFRLSLQFTDALNEGLDKTPGSDLAWLSKWSLLPSRRDPLKFDRLAFLNTELLIRFPCSDETNASGFTKALSHIGMNETSNCPSDRLECFVHLRLSYMDHCIGFPPSFLGMQRWSQHFCNSPSSRSESARLSTESSKMHLRLEVGRLW